MPDSTEKIVMWAGLGVGVAALVIGALNLMNQPTVSSTPSGQTLNLPGGDTAPATYQPATFVVPGLTVTGSTPSVNPGTSVVFNLGGGGGFQPTGAGGFTGGLAGSGGGAGGHGKGSCGCGSADGATGPCNAPGATTNAFGDPATAAAGIMAAMGPAITAAFNVGSEIRQQQNWDLAAGGVGGSALFVPPATIPTLGGILNV